MACGVIGCKRKVKHFGVCGLHKNYAYYCDTDEFRSDMENLQSIIRIIHEQSDILEKRGINLLGIQAYWNNNLSTSRQHPLPEHFQTVGQAMDQINPLISTLKQKYDPNLVTNTVARINHSFIPERCDCKICMLGH